MKPLLKRKWLLTATVVIILATIAFFSVRSSHAASTAIPTALVRRGEFVDYLSIRGEIKARQSTTLTAPSAAGDLQIIKLAHTGQQVKAGDVIVQFDTTTLQRTLEQKRTDLASAEAEIRQQQAQERMTEEQNLTDSLAAKYNVESARLDASKAEILSVIDGEKNKLALASSQEKFREAQTKLDSGRLGSAADIKQKEKKRDKALFDVRLAEHQIASLTMRAPSDGVVTLLPNFRAVMFGGNAPDFREGDHAWPGAAIAEIPDLSSIRFEARVEEADRGKLKADQIGTVHVDAVPDTDFTGRVREISTLAKMDFSSWPPMKNFTLDLRIDHSDPRIRPGMKANARIAVDSIPNTILVPTQALFQKNGSAVVYVQAGRKFEEKAVRVGRRSGETAQILDGVIPGDYIALKNPTELPQNK
ncbi:MAG TPA: efflux RND transporter periplasmic adaptor subunit [Terriglobales bacterium]|nr:efflux RND transporter periplasmic adaptor subunit [Terriglobales bacterium]